MRWKLCLLFFALATACGSDNNSGGGILIASEQDGDWEVFLVDPEENLAHQLTDNRAYDTRALWSPDGTHLTFTSDRLEGKEYDATLFGDDQTQVQGEETQGRSIYIMQFEDLEVVQFTTDGNADHASWSPDGSQIAFVHDLPVDEPGDQAFRRYDVEIYTMDADGNNVQRLTDSPGEDWFPSWSPDGSRLAFTSQRTGDWEIYTMDPDGNNVQQLTNSPGQDWDARWSPDGSRLAFASQRTGNWDIYTMDPDGNNVQQLTDHGRHDVTPIWSPDGSHIAFASQRTGPWEVFVVASGGGDIKRLGFGGIPSDWR